MDTAMEMTGPGPLLLATKLHQPVWRDGLVSRSRLAAALSRGEASKLTLISAPAGFGKSTLLAEWLAQTSASRRTAWVSLDQGDNDPALFWSYVIAAMRTQRADFGEHALSLVRAMPAAPIESMLVSLINELSRSPESFALVLDDFHVIEQRSIHEGIGFLLDHLPPQLRLIVTTRADPPLNLSRLRARGELTELRATDLRFTPEEAAAFLNDVMRLGLTDDDVRALEARSEGWIAGLQLAALSLRDHHDASGFIRTFAGDHRYIVDYLLEEVLQRQPDATRAFLLQTSILERMSGPLCDAVTGQHDGSERLAALERGNFFLVPLDSTRTWFRYHHLFGDVLRARLLAEYPGQIEELHLRASIWFEQQCATAEAIDHALAAGDSGRAAELIELAATAMRKNRQEATLLGWLAALPTEEIRRRPVLCMLYAGVLMQNGASQDVERWLDEADRWLDRIADAAPDAPDGMQVVDREEFERLPGSAAVHRAGAALASGDVPGTIEHARRALQVAPEDDHLYRGAAAALLGLASWSNGVLDVAYDSFAEGMDRLRRAGNIIDIIGGALALADIRRAQGRLRDALAIYQHSLRISREHGSPPPRGTADMVLGMSELSREWNDPDAAALHLAQSETLGEAAGFPQFPYRLRVAQARLRSDLGDLDGALALLDEAERRYVSDMYPNVRPIPAIRARILIDAGQLDEVFTWATTRNLSVDDAISYRNAFELLTLARALLARATLHTSSDVRPAMQLLGRLRRAADDGKWTALEIEALMLLALAHRQLGDHVAAHAALERALALAEPGGSIRTFLDEGEPMWQLLQGAQGAYAQRLLQAWGVPDHPMATSAPVSLLPEPLTPRELEILRLIASGMRNQEIADRLFISLPTVKRHVANAYGKLGVAHRTEAVARANTLGILES
jgi:LuxR family maltose regulon positive regulatory protein